MRDHACGITTLWWIAKMYRLLLTCMQSAMALSSCGLPANWTCALCLMSRYSLCLLDVSCSGCHSEYNNIYVVTRLVRWCMLSSVSVHALLSSCLQWVTFAAVQLASCVEVPNPHAIANLCVTTQLSQPMPAAVSCCPLQLLLKHLSCHVLLMGDQQIAYHQCC